MQGTLVGGPAHRVAACRADRAARNLVVGTKGGADGSPAGRGLGATMSGLAGSRSVKRAKKGASSKRACDSGEKCWVREIWRARAMTVVRSGPRWLRARII